MMKCKLQEADALLDTLKNAVVLQDKGDELPVLIDRVCEVLNQKILKMNPLFATTISCLRERK